MQKTFNSFNSFLCASLALITLMAVAVPARANTNSTTMEIPFNNVQYFHRWSKAGQNEFTPKDETDLDKWQEMVTINVYDSVKTDEQLATTANKVLGNYQANGKIIKTDSKPRTPTSPAEHLAVAVLGNPKLLECAFARFLMVDGTGVCVVFSHRVYGSAVGPQMSDWLKTAGPGVEKSLMGWKSIPAIMALKKLPQSTQ